ncbi:hypothetical protein [Pedobacter agri]|uniref:hypothetical protein n=1 Tax=Pedobacter agri TaxID=454586 RepID=UPI00292DC941|nr:hypothetical protein [Pedobacter agri]
MNAIKRIFISLFVSLISIAAKAQTQSEPPAQNISTDSAVVYRLFTTRNKWTYIKLNTRNGQMWQVQYSLEDNNREDALSLLIRVPKEEEKNGRFFLYPTQNMYNFILLDQLDGRVWQVQWSIEEKSRMVVRIN